MKYMIYSAAASLLLFISADMYARDKTNQSESNKAEFDTEKSLQNTVRHRIIEKYREEILNRNPEGFLFIPEAPSIIETYRIKILKVFNDARESKLKLREQVRDLKQDLYVLMDKYQADRSVSNEIISNLLDLRSVQKQILEINKTAMKNILILNDAREKDLREAGDRWLNKIETDSNELDNFVEEYKNHIINHPELMRRQPDENDPEN